jgi:hypothetical protein
VLHCKFDEGKKGQSASSNNHLVMSHLTCRGPFINTIGDILQAAEIMQLIEGLFQKKISHLHKFFHNLSIKTGS